MLPAGSRAVSATDQAGRRAARNTGVRAAAEMVGKLSTLLLFAVLAREVGEADLGVFVFAFAFLGLVLIPIGFGTDSYLLRQIARDRRPAGGPPTRRALDELFWNVLALKLTVTVPVLGVGAVALVALGYPADTRLVVAVLGIGLLLDVFAKSFHAVFTAFERSELLAFAIVVQRVMTAGLGVAVLLAGGALLEVSAVFTLGSALHLALGTLFMARAIGLPRISVARSRWRGLTTASFPFAAQDIFIVLLFKLDAVLLSVLATDAAVGRYGAAYRLLESTLFVTYALNGAFVAMYAYLGRDTEPTVGAVFGRSIKAALVVLVPVAVTLGVLAEPVSGLIFGAGLRDAGPALRVLAPVVVLLSLVTFCSSLIVSRRSPGTMVRISAVMVLVNVVLNLALIPPLEEVGAAIAMLVTEVAFVAAAMWVAARAVGGLDWAVVFTGPLVAGAAMAALLVALRDLPVAGVAAGVVAYVALLTAWERARNPADLDFVAQLIRRRQVPGRAGA